MGEVVTQAEYARRSGRSQAWATKMKRQGRLVLTSDGLVDVDATDAALAETLDISKQRTPLKTDKEASVPGSGHTPSGAYASAAAAHKAAQAALAEAKLKVMRDQLLDRSMVEKAASDALRVARDKLLVLPMRLAPMLAGLSDRREVYSLLKKELTGALHDLADALRRLPDGDGSVGEGGEAGG